VELDGSLTEPRSLVVASQHVCFVAHLTYSSEESVYCYTSDGLSYTQLTLGDGEPRNPHSLLVAADGVLYLKAQAPFGGTPAEGVVYRAEPPSATVLLLSRPSTTA